MSDGCAVVTGAGSGIGAATAMALASSGVDVVAASRNPGKLADHVGYEDVESRLDLVTADLTKPDDVDEVFGHAESAHGRVRFVVHSVGFNYRVGWFRENQTEDVVGALAALFTSPVLVLRRALRSMRTNSGAVGLISSGAARRPTPGRALYSSTKIAVNRLVESVAAECAEEDPTTAVFAIYPGRVDTPMQRQLMDVAQEAPSAFRLDRFRSADDVFSPDAVGAAIASLAHREPTHLNGRIFRYRPDGWVERDS